jgi:hypothetical protein
MLKIISFLCLAIGAYCGYVNYMHGHNLILIPAGIAVTIGLFCAVRDVKKKNSDVLAWILAVCNGLLVAISILILVGVILSTVM